MVKKETVSVVCSSSSTCLVCSKPESRPGLVFPSFRRRTLATGLSPSLAELCFCPFQMTSPSSTLGSAPVLYLLSSPTRNDFSVWQLEIRLLAQFPSFAPLDLTKQDSCLPSP